MRTLTLTFRLLAFGVVLCLGLFNSVNSFAQTAPNFTFKLEAFDAQTHGAVTVETKQVVFGVLVTNNTATNYNVELLPTLELVVNIPQDGNGLIDMVTPLQPAEFRSGLPAFSTQLLYIATSSTNNFDIVKLENTSPRNHSLLGTVVFNFAYTGTTTQTLNGLTATGVIYK